MVFVMKEHYLHSTISSTRQYALDKTKYAYINIQCQRKFANNDKKKQKTKIIRGNFGVHVICTMRSKQICAI